MTMKTITAQCNECEESSSILVDATKADRYMIGYLTNTQDVLGEDWNPRDSEILINAHRIHNNMWNNYYLCEDCWEEHIKDE